MNAETETQIRPLVNQFAGTIERLIEQRAVEIARERIERAFPSNTPAPTPKAETKRVVAAKPKAPKAPNAPTTAAAKQHGAYMGGLNSLGKAARARVKTERAKRGIQAALKLIAKLRPATTVKKTS